MKINFDENQYKAQIKSLVNFMENHPDSREMKRALAVKFALQGYGYKKISSLLNVSKSFVSKWKKIFQDSGIEGLMLKHKGAKKKLTSVQESETIQWLLEQEYLDISELEVYLIQSYDVVFKSKVSYYKIYKKAKLTRQKAEKVNPQKNPEKVKKINQEINKILLKNREHLEAGTLVAYAIDECHLMGGDFVDRAWGDPKKRVEIPVKNYRDRQTYYGALNLLTPQLVLEKYPTGNGDCKIS